jgi:outer membrane protein insertion porin family
VKAITNAVEAKYFRPNFHKRNVIALHFLGQFATGWGGLELPPYNRLYLGGENDLRGFDIRTVSPIVFIPVASTTSASYTNPRVLDSTGAPTVTTLTMPMLNYQISFPGGDTSGVFNGEYRIPIAGPVSVSLFTDAGTDGHLAEGPVAVGSERLFEFGHAIPYDEHQPLAADSTRHEFQAAHVRRVSSL